MGTISVEIASDLDDGTERTRNLSAGLPVPCAGHPVAYILRHVVRHPAGHGLARLEEAISAPLVPPRAARPPAGDPAAAGDRACDVVKAECQNFILARTSGDPDPDEVARRLVVLIDRLNEMPVRFGKEMEFRQLTSGQY